MDDVTPNAVDSKLFITANSDLGEETFLELNNGQPYLTSSDTSQVSICRFGLCILASSDKLWHFTGQFKFTDFGSVFQQTTFCTPSVVWLF